MLLILKPLLGFLHKGSVKVLLLSLVGVFLYSAGANSVDRKWLKKELEYTSMINSLQNKIGELESEHRKVTEGIRNQLKLEKETYETKLKSLNAEHAGRLQLSQSRAEVYRRKAEAGSTECGSLASYTTKLDRTLEEGRKLVGELQTTVRLYESQLRLLGDQLQADRELLTKEPK